MDFRNFSSIVLNGRFYDRESLLRKSSNKLKDSGILSWQNEIYRFITEWLDDRDHVLVRTSGSTSKPKTISIKKQAMVVSALKTGQFLELKKGGKALLCMPAKYIAGKMMIVRAMALELDLTLVEPSSNPLKNFSANFDFAAMVPLQVHEILEEKDGPEKLNAIKNLIIGGGPISKSLRKKIGQLTNRSFSTYGMTETITHIAMEPLNGPEADGWLSTLPDVAVGLDNENRLIIDAPDILDHSIQTNDLAEMQDENKFRLLGRYDNIINSGGIKIIPEVVEKKLEKIISNRFVISSQPDDRLGEKLVLVIKGKPDKEFQKGTFLNRLATFLNKYEKPQHVFFLPHFPEAGNRKTDRNKIREMISGIK